jgi:large subunit ribosomal protein L17
MNHRKVGRKLSRIKKQRTALIKTLIGSFMMSGKMKTTEAKAKEVRPIIEKLITAAKNKKQNPVELKRYLLNRLPVKVVAKVTELGDKKYANRQGGYTRITKLNPRKSDGARMAIIELV